MSIETKCDYCGEEYDMRMGRCPVCCLCSDPANCTEAAPGKICRAGRTIWQDQEAGNVAEKDDDRS